MIKLLLAPFKLLALLVGNFSWTAPSWLRSLSSWLIQHLRLTIIALLVVTTCGGGYFYYQSLPKPVQVIAVLNDIEVMPSYYDDEPSRLLVEFEYDLASLHPKQAKPEGKPSAARIDLVGQRVETGIELMPSKKGEWRWISDRELEFIPETDWPAGAEYQLNLTEGIFAADNNLAKSKYLFHTPPITAEFAYSDFYQDPLQGSSRKVVTTIEFSHPVDKDSLEQHLKMSMRESGESISATPRDYQYSVSYSENMREAYIHSENINLPERTNYMLVELLEGVKSLLGGTGTKESAQIKVTIPDVYSFLKVESNVQIIRNQQNEPQQIVTLDFTDALDRKELLNKLSIYALPINGERQGRRRWDSPRQVSSSVLANSKQIDFEILPNADEASKLYSLKIEQQPNRFLYLKLEGGFSSINQFKHASKYDDILRVPEYPREISIAGEGSVLSYSGNHQLSVLTRGVSALKYTIGRVRNSELNHLISQTEGDISNPEFMNWNFDEKNISEMQSSIVKLRKSHPKNANYSSFDLSAYLSKGTNRYGLFFVDIQEYDLKRKRTIYGATDRRLILITDLGLLVKNNSDKSHDVFVQSIATGEPVANAKLELIGKNGLAVYSGTTDSSGHIKIPVTRSLNNDKQPTLYTVESKGDRSFIPFNRYSRQINLSRFDIGGVHSSEFSEDSLNAFVFSDRGIYRPGETANFGMIVKSANFENIEDIPLELVIQGPRYNEVKVDKFRLPKKGLSEFEFETLTSSDTGRYTASLHLVRDDNRRGYEIGSTDFRVEEFQPDTMRIESKLVDIQQPGWNTKEKLTAKVTLTNLFGTVAQNRTVRSRLIIEPHNFRFKEFSDYRFTDPFYNDEKKPLSLNQSLKPQQTNADGVVEFELDLTQFQQGTYRLRFLTEGFDQAGGRSVSTANATLISPLSTLVGYKSDGRLDYINANSKRTLEFVAINQSLKQIAASDLTLVLKEIQTVSTLVKQEYGTFEYQSIEKQEMLSSENITVTESGYQYNIDSSNPGDYVIEIIDSQGRRLSHLKYSIVGYANLSGRIDKSAELELKLNKQDYFPGEFIEMNVRAPYKGAGLITIETNKVIKHKWFKTEQESSVQRIQLPDDIEGTGYINVSFLRDASSDEIFTAPLSYAVKPFSIDKSKRNIEISLDSQSVVRPGKPMDIVFSTSKASKIVIFAVDEGILQVANYATPNPLSHFMKKRSLGVETFQILDLLLPDFETIKRLSATGGGAEQLNRALAKNINPFSRKTDKPAVFWSGIYDAETHESKVSFDVPDTFAGELRIMAVAVSENAVGATRTSSIVRGPFVISPNLLTHAAPGDEFIVTVGVANIIEGSGKAAPVELVATVSEHLEIVGPSLVKLAIDEGGEKSHSFKVKANTKLGAALINFSVSHKQEQTSRSASLSIRPATNYFTSLTSGVRKDDAMQLPIERQLYTDLATQTLAVSKSPLVIVDGLHSYLETYPHGCTEQVVSKVFPLVGLMSHPAYSPHLKDVKAQFSVVIDKLRERQNSDGGFSFWPGASRSAGYPSIYAMHFLLDASEKGFPVPRSMLRRGQDFLETRASQKSRNLTSARDRANAIYLLTRMGVVTTNYLVDLEDDINRKNASEDRTAIDWQQDILSTYMAATYKMLQKDQEAERLLLKFDFDGEHQQTNDFRSKLAIDAQYLYLLAKHFDLQAKAFDLKKIHQLTDKVFKGEYNTISAAYSILALGAYSELVLSHDSKESITVNALKQKVEQALAVEFIPFATSTYPVGSEQLQVSGEGPLYYLNRQSGFNSNVSANVVRDGIEVYRSFVDEEGNEVTEIEQGKELTVKLKIRALNQTRLSNIAVIDLLPGGFEVIRSSLDRSIIRWHSDYIDVREDRVVFYGSFDKHVKEISYKVKVTTAGDFIVPPTYAESMYNQSIRAISKSSRFSVIDSE